MRAVFIWPVLALSAGVLAGLTAFGDEQSHRSALFWAEHRLPLGRAWFVKIAIHLGLLVWLLVMLALPCAIRTQFQSTAGAAFGYRTAPSQPLFQSRLFDELGVQGWKYILDTGGLRVRVRAPVWAAVPQVGGRVRGGGHAGWSGGNSVGAVAPGRWGETLAGVAAGRGPAVHRPVSHPGVGVRSGALIAGHFCGLSASPRPRRLFAFAVGLGYRVLQAPDGTGRMQVGRLGVRRRSAIVRRERSRS